MEKLSLYAVGGITLTSLMSFLMPNYRDNIQVASHHDQLKTETITYPSPKGGGEISAQHSVQKRPRANFPESWWCTKTGDSTPILPTWAEGQPWRDLSALPRMRSPLWVAIPATMMRAGHCSGNATGMKCWKTFSPPLTI